MGIVPPPLPLSKKEFDKRWKAGARTIEELDPEFVKWCRSGKRQLIILYIAVTLFVLITCVVIIGAMIV